MAPHLFTPMTCVILALFLSCHSEPLAVKGAPGSRFDLTHWYLQLPINNVETHRPPELLTYFHKDYFYLDTDNTMTFMSITNGAHTPNSKYARSELREMYKGSSDTDWKISDDGGKHVLSAKVSVPSCAIDNQKVTVGQIHTVNADIPIIVEMQWIAGRISAMYSQRDSSDHKYQKYIFKSNPGSKTFTYTILVSKNKLILTVDGESAPAIDISGWKSSPQYFKAGDYPQSNVGAKKCTVKFHTLCVKHGAVSCVDPKNQRVADETTSPSNQGLVIGLSVGLGCALLVVLALLAFIVYRSRAPVNESV